MRQHNADESIVNHVGMLSGGCQKQLDVVTQFLRGAALDVDSVERFAGADDADALA